MHNPASANKYQAKEVARDLLLEERKYHGNHVAIFAMETVTDCDTKLIEEQADKLDMLPLLKWITFLTKVT